MPCIFFCPPSHSLVWTLLVKTAAWMEEYLVSQTQLNFIKKEMKCKCTHPIWAEWWWVLRLFIRPMCMCDELITRRVQVTEHVFLYKACAHNLFLSWELRTSFAHAIIYCILHPIMNYNCLSPFFSVAHELPEGRGNFWSILISNTHFIGMEALSRLWDGWVGVKGKKCK